MTQSANPHMAREYRKIAIEHEVNAASPHRLIQMMMERALTRISLAKSNMLEERVAVKAKLIGDAINIVCGLQVSLNHEIDRTLGSNFDALYDYMTRRLLEANLNNDPAALDEVTGLLGELKSAWDAIEDPAPEDDLR